MCGIFALIIINKPHKFNFNLYQEYLNSPYITKRPEVIEELLTQNQRPNNIDLDLDKLQLLNARGPDYQGKIELHQPYYQLLYHSLLHMRGDQDTLIKQPLIKEQFILQYNGEIYNINPDESDTIFLMNRLQQANSIHDIKNLLQQLNGDYSLIFQDLSQQKIYIAKDPFGKRSMLLSFINEGFILSSQALQKNIPLEIEEEEDDEDDGKTVDEKYLMKKYLNEFNQAINKSCIELPNNSIIEIDLSGQQIQWNKIQISEFLNFDQIQQIDLQNTLDQNICKIYDILIKSTKEIIQNIFGFQNHFINGQNIKQNQQQGRIGILFSGGIDCSLITHIVCKLLPDNSQIDLINVAFTNDAPDRITARNAHQELQNLHKNQLLNLILIDKTLDDVYKEEKLFLEILYPKITHMDFNIAMILNIASSYNVETRVLLSGLGADEIFCGYARYKHALKRGYAELIEEMNFDLFRLWNRNLGRDDRAVSKNGKELRFPFLNIELVQFIRQNIHPSQYIMGDTKSILRIICQKEGLNVISKHGKKAIQFGTKIAKLSNKRFFGGNKKAKGTLNYNIK
ncbi:unnamed protein product [Paramecium primaurelia]|uniref:Glutamine amidotransferase type-2 domain-containing protein n=1 Tax=Paramecium primaurelia TaxID=5886 RepID=A0A8S1JU10_PARPR|nr:unnamed protein product [Paramecium primaurelia]